MMTIYTITLGRKPDSLSHILHFKGTSLVTVCFATIFPVCTPQNWQRSTTDWPNGLRTASLVLS